MFHWYREAFHLRNFLDQKDKQGTLLRQQQRSGICHTDPRAHPKTVRKFPLTAHITEDTDEEVKDNQLVRTAVIKPLVERYCFPDGVEMKSDCIWRRNNCARNNIVAIDKWTSNRFTNAININRRCCHEGSNKTDGCCKERWNHKNSKPSNIKTVICRSYPGAEILPSGCLIAF